SHEGLVGQGNSTVTTEYNFVDRAVTNGVTYYYRLADRDFTGRIYYHDPISATPNAAGVEIQRSEPVTSHFQLFPNYPNPFNPETTIRFELPVLSDGLNRIRLSVYNIAGQLVRTLYEGELAGGVYEMKWDGTSDLGVRQPSGIYFLYLQAGTLVQTRRMVLLQ
ncbi:MAG: T9SS C-terminal target domain-containing protein, partial [Calditrichaeota bacterium]